MKVSPFRGIFIHLHTSSSLPARPVCVRRKDTAQSQEDDQAERSPVPTFWSASFPDAVLCSLSPALHLCRWPSTSAGHSLPMGTGAPAASSEKDLLLWPVIRSGRTLFRCSSQREAAAAEATNPRQAAAARSLCRQPYAVVLSLFSLSKCPRTSEESRVGENDPFVIVDRPLFTVQPRLWGCGSCVSPGTANRRWPRGSVEVFLSIGIVPMWVRLLAAGRRLLSGLGEADRMNVF